MGSATALRTRRVPSRITPSRRAWGVNWPARSSPPPNLPDGEIARGPAQGGGVEPVGLRRRGGPVRPLFPRRPAWRRPLMAGRRRLACKTSAMATPRAISFAPAADGKQMIGHIGSVVDAGRHHDAIPPSRMRSFRSARATTRRAATGTTRPRSSSARDRLCAPTSCGRTS